MTSADADANQRARRILKWIFGGSAMLLWFVALGLPAYSDGTPGVGCLFLGWSMIFSGNTFAFLAWLSNFLFLPALLLIFFGLRKKIFRTAVLLCGLSALLSFGAFTVVEIDTGAPSGILQIVHPTIGAYLWVLAHIVGLIAALLCNSNAGRYTPSGS